MNVSLNFECVKSIISHITLSTSAGSLLHIIFPLLHFLVNCGLSTYNKLQVILKFVDSSLCVNHAPAECCSRTFFIKELSNLFVHARICDHILINISHVASVISSFRSPSNKESSWSWKTLCSQHFTLKYNKRKLFGARNKFLISDGISFGLVLSQHVHWWALMEVYQDMHNARLWACIKIMKESLSCLVTSLASASKSVEFFCSLHSLWFPKWRIFPPDVKQSQKESARHTRLNNFPKAFHPIKVQYLHNELQRKASVMTFWKVLQKTPLLSEPSTYLWWQSD